jgi:hypothetical protein
MRRHLVLWAVFTLSFLAELKGQEQSDAPGHLKRE